MTNACFEIPVPGNEPVYSYAPGSPERSRLIEELERQYRQRLEIPLLIGGREVRTGRIGRAVCPHEHGHVLAEFHQAGAEEVRAAVAAALAARDKWARVSWFDRAAIFLKAAELVAGKYRFVLNAATMLNQSKNPHEAEIDAVAELADFLRFNVYFMQKIYTEQPLAHAPGSWNRSHYRPLEGFVLAVSPFNFTSIAGNLAAAPALMGNVVVWKPASTSVLSSFYLMEIFREAGLPDGVINFVPGPGSVVGPVALDDEHLAGVHYTGSTEVFSSMWTTIGGQIKKYRSYPRLVGETGGKDFVIVHPGADLDAASVALARGAFEYQGQKCSAVSRAYVAESCWAGLWRRLEPMVEEIRASMGDPRNFSFFNAVISKGSFDRTMTAIRQAGQHDAARVIAGGKGDDTTGYFVEPTVILTRDPHYVTMREELFAPVLTVTVYADDRYEEMLRICDSSTPYALTGALFAGDRDVISRTMELLGHAAGNFYINDKPTGAVVGQQPFGGARASGTNDKAGSFLNLLRWTSPQTIKENFAPPRDFRYPFMAGNGKA
jgi:1-pyrroline-5-carboxylate dehydrogenase